MIYSLPATKERKSLIMHYNKPDLGRCYQTKKSASKAAPAMDSAKLLSSPDAPAVGTTVGEV
jgi:hypothetical protein